MALKAEWMADGSVGKYYVVSGASREVLVLVRYADPVTVTFEILMESAGVTAMDAIRAVSEILTDWK